MKVLIYPKGDNPYQELLYQELRKQPNGTFNYVEATRLNIFFFPALLIVKRLQGYNIMHLHWLAFETNILRVYGKQLSLLVTLWSLTWLKLLGFKVVWTVHNVLPHEPLTSNDLLVARYLSRIAAAKIIHSRGAIEQTRQLHISTDHTVTIPHGNYAGVYPDTITRSQARRELLIKSEDFVILFFGMIRPYKGIDELLAAFTALDRPNVRLIIAGKCFDSPLDNKIQAARRHLTIDYYEGFIDDTDVAKYFKACDVVCLPFKAVTTSGSALLAATFGKPIIAPYLGALRDIPRNVGLLYPPEDDNALRTSLLHLIDNKPLLQKMGQASLAYSKSISWDRIAQQTLNVYENILKR